MCPPSSCALIIRPCLRLQKLNTTLLNSLGLPCHVDEVSLAHLRVEVSWLELFSSPLLIEADGISVRCSIRTAVSAEEFNSIQLMMLDSVIKGMEDVIRGAAALPAAAGKPMMLSGVMRRLFVNLTVRIMNVVVAVRLPSDTESTSPTLALTLESLTIGRPLAAAASAVDLRKRVSFTKLAVYLDEDMDQGEHAYILQPLSGNANVQLSVALAGGTSAAMAAEAAQLTVQLNAFSAWSESIMTALPSASLSGDAARAAAMNSLFDDPVLFCVRVCHGQPRSQTTILRVLTAKFLSLGISSPLIADLLREFVCAYCEQRPLYELDIELRSA